MTIAPLDSVRRAAPSVTREPSLSRSSELSIPVVWLASLVGVLALLAAGAGLFWQGGRGPDTVTTVRGEVIDLYGHGLYRYDSLFAGAAAKGTDAVTLGLGIPLLIVSLILYHRGSLRGGLLLMGSLVWFVYVYASRALSDAYNGLFLLYVALFSGSLCALLLASRALDPDRLARAFAPRLPRRAPAIFMLVSGFVTSAIWLEAPIRGLVAGETPAPLDNATTLVTHTLDLGIIVPVAIAAGVLILRRSPLGYLLAIPMLVLEAALAPMIVAQTISQVDAGVSFTTGEIVGPISGFTVLALGAIWMIIWLLRTIHDPLSRGPSTTAH